MIPPPRRWIRSSVARAAAALAKARKQSGKPRWEAERGVEHIIMVRARREREREVAPRGAQNARERESEIIDESRR